MWILVVCVFQGIHPFHVITLCGYRTVHTFCSYFFFFYVDELNSNDPLFHFWYWQLVSSLSSPPAPWLALLEVYKFYWSFKRNSFWLCWFFSIVFLVSISLSFALLFHFFFFTVSLSLNWSLYVFFFWFQFHKNHMWHPQTPLDCKSMLNINYIILSFNQWRSRPQWPKLLLNF